MNRQRNVWTIYVCEGCGGQVLETYEYKHQGEGHGRHVEVEVVPKALADELAQAIESHTEDAHLTIPAEKYREAVGE